MKQTIKNIILFFALVFVGAGHAWAMSASDITINVQPSNSAGTVTVPTENNFETVTGGTKVIITAVPASGYLIDADHILAEKMVNAQSRRRAPGLADRLDVTSEGEDTYSFVIPDGYTGAYVTVTFYKAAEGFTQITDLSQITDMNGKYQLTADVYGVSTSLGNFTGTLDGGFHKIIGSSAPLFSSTSGDAVIRNVIFEDVNINLTGSNKDAGAITPEAKENTRIYNCGILPTTTEYDNDGNITGFSGSSISGTRYVGGLVGFLDGTARVINCYSYANITGGTMVGGIVGYNNIKTTSANLKTMVMNCMFYGDITGSTNKAPIYNGQIITNVSTGTGTNNKGVGNYNYFSAEASYVQNRDIQTYNCALMAETRYLQRFEFFRHLLNGHRELAAWWATGNRANKDMMAKWVLEPSQIGGNYPFPILKTPGYYPSVVNLDADNAPITTERNKGGKLGTLTVHIQMGSGGAQFGPPTGAVILSGKSSLTLNITDKDPDHFNFNYYKVQLPYYNDVGTNNYRKASDGTSRVVTGWKITSITGGTTGSYTTGTDATATVGTNGEITLATPYNFADRHCTNKDLYSVSGRVFNQGAYWDVPEGVTAITIEPYWAKCVYLADPNADKVYNQAMTTGYDVPNVGGEQIYTNGNSYSIAGENQVVYTTIGNAIASSATALFAGVTATSHTVYDYAVVLVGNYHNYNSIEAGGGKPYTVTSIDLDGDNEPDYSFMLRFDSRKGFHPVRYDFLNLVGLGMAQKSTGGKGTYNFGILQPKYWFEVTNTALFRVTQMEYDAISGRVAAPIILHGGVIEQWVSCQATENNKVTYFHVGGNVWFKEFHLGCHQDKSDKKTKHPPVSVTGGDYDAFYLTGLYATTINYNDNAECYINGGRFGTVAGAGMEGIGNASTHANGNIVWQIDHADIEEFYGGGINAAKPIEGNITTIINNSNVDLFCGGPKFGDMYTGRTVTTTATDCTFGTYFGAGYGGNSYNRAAPFNFTWDTDVNYVIEGDSDKAYNVDWDKWIKGEIKASGNDSNPNTGDYSNGVEYTGYNQDYISEFGGVSVRIDYQFLPNSNNKTNVARLFLDFVSFSLATTHDVKSTLTDCTVTGNFYGGGSLGKVTGDVTSTLTDCTVNGNAFGAGFSATLPTVEVMKTGGFKKQPYYDKNLGVYLPGEYKESDTYTWEHANTVDETANAIDKDDNHHVLYTTEDLNNSNLGSVAGNVSLTIKGTNGKGSVIGTEGDTTGEKGNVFGGGDQSYVTPSVVNNQPVAGTGNTTVTLQGNTQVLGNVFGGGNKGDVKGNTEVNIE